MKIIDSEATVTYYLGFNNYEFSTLRLYKKQYAYLGNTFISE